MKEVDCQGKISREINREIRRLIQAGEQEIRVLHPQARHNLGVAILQQITLTITGSVGYYCGGLMDVQPLRSKAAVAGDLQKVC